MAKRAEVTDPCDPCPACGGPQEWQKSGYKRKDGSSGYTQRCRPCRAAYMVEFEKTRDRIDTTGAERQRKYRQRHPLTPGQYAEVAARMRAWVKANPERHAANRDRRRARISRCEGSHTGDEWKAVLKKYGNKCVDCGIKGTREKPLEKDHDIPFARGGTNFAYNLRPRCLRCNRRKHANLLDGSHHSIFDRLTGT